MTEQEARIIAANAKLRNVYIEYYLSLKLRAAQLKEVGAKLEQIEIKERLERIADGG